MGEQTNISWTDHTFNPWWGCWKISDECTHCYAEAFDHRLNGGHWGRTEPRRFFGDAHWNEPRRWNRAAEKAGARQRVFAGSMCDWAERHPLAEVNARMDDARARLFALIEETSWLDWLLLTKRPENFATMLPWVSKTCTWCKPPGSGVDTCETGGRCVSCGGSGRSDADEPWPNVWLGVTSGVRSSLDRVAILRRTPAVVRFVSCEPLLERIAREDWDRALDPASVGAIGDVHWLIVGDESGHGARPAHPAWVREARDAADRHSVAFHFKQWAGADADGIGGPRVKGKRHLPLLDEVQHAAFPAPRR